MDKTEQSTIPAEIEVRGGRVHNLKNINVNIPLHKFVAISGLSGSGKSSLAMGILYEEGSRRYLEALSTYTRRRIKLGAQAQVDSVKHIPSALALHQRPLVPSERATVGTMSEIFNVIRLIFSRLGSPVCPNGHRLKPSLKIAQVMSKSGDEMGQLTCPVCGAKFYAFSAEDFAFNSDGACKNCQGIGRVRELDESKLIGDENLTLDEGAVSSWHLPGRNFMPQVAEQAGVRINVPYKDLSDKEKDFVLNGPSKKYKMDFVSGTGRVFHDFNALYENAHEAVLESAKTSKSARAQQRINEFFHSSVCPVCNGDRYNKEIQQVKWHGYSIVDLLNLDVRHAIPVFEDVPKIQRELKLLDEVGLGYLHLGESTPTLSGGEAQRLKLVKHLNRQQKTTLFVFDEPSVGLHPLDVQVLLQVMQRLIDRGATIIIITHDVNLMVNADYLIDLGPRGGRNGGKIVAKGRPSDLIKDPESLTTQYLAEFVQRFTK